MPVTIGEAGRAVTPLRPTGFVEINGTRLEAKLAPSKTTIVETGADVVVVGVDTFGVLVKAACDVAHPTALTDFGEAIATPHEHGQLRDELEQQNREEEAEKSQRDLQRETMIFAIPLLAAFAGGYLVFGLQAAVALAVAWVVVFFGIGLAIMFFGSES